MKTAAVPSTARAETSWHSLPLPEVLAGVETTEAGLGENDARARRERFGPNQLPEQPGPTVRQIVLRQFQSPLIYILGIAAVVSVLLGEFVDAGFILAVLALNAVIGGYQEWRAEQSSRALQKLLRIRASVVRDGETREIDAEDVVPGDIVWMESGNRVPSDLRLLSSQGLEIDESLLTGESLPVQKNAGWLGEPTTPMGDRLNMAFAGATVIRGRGRGVVVATGAQTAVGQLALDVMTAVGGKPPLVVRMERFTHAIAIGILGAVVVVGLLGIFARGHTLTDMFMFSVALAVSAIPEGLPVAMTVALAVATTRMARRHVIVRRLVAVEGLGSCTMIASDKTGTLTCNELTVREVRLGDDRVFEVTGEGFAPVGEVLANGRTVPPGSEAPLTRIALAGALCNEADLHQRDGTWIWRGDPTDLALLSLAHKTGSDPRTSLRALPRVAQIPFESERQFAASYHRDGQHTPVFVKGAPERILSLCSDAVEPQRRAKLLAQAEGMAERGYRVLALAEGVAGASFDPARPPEEPQELRFLGYVGMIDPLRPGVREAIATCHQAGIEVRMITGDHPVTALAIARDLGMADDPRHVVSGAELLEKPREALVDAVRTTRVFARVAPRQKLELVEAAQEAGHYVAVTGDGVNDAPALRKANIGIAMGKAGTDVAREAAELVITDDNFATIVAGVEEGRIAYSNVRKVIYLLISTGVAEVLLLGTALLTGMPLPLLPAQLLWLPRHERHPGRGPGVRAGGRRRLAPQTTSATGTHLQPPHAGAYRRRRGGDGRPGVRVVLLADRAPEDGGLFRPQPAVDAHGAAGERARVQLSVGDEVRLPAVAVAEPPAAGRRGRGAASPRRHAVPAAGAEGPPHGAAETADVVHAAAAVGDDAGRHGVTQGGVARTSAGATGVVRAARSTRAATTPATCGVCLTQGPRPTPSPAPASASTACPTDLGAHRPGGRWAPPRCRW